MFEENPQETPERLEELERRKEALDQAIIVEEANIYDKDKVELQEVSEDELFEFVGVEVFDNFVTCSTNETATLLGWLFRLFRTHMECNRQTIRRL